MECVCACVYLEPIIQRKISYNNALYMDSRKMVLMSPFSGQQWRRRHRELTCRQGMGVKACVGLMERVAWKHTLPYVKQLASGNLLCDKGSSTWCSVKTERGGLGWEIGERFKREKIHGRFILTYGRNQHNIVKQLSSN